MHLGIVRNLHWMKEFAQNRCGFHHFDEDGYPWFEVGYYDGNIVKDVEHPWSNAWSARILKYSTAQDFAFHGKRSVPCNRAKYKSRDEKWSWWNCDRAIRIIGVHKA